MHGSEFGCLLCFRELTHLCSIATHLCSIAAHLSTTSTHLSTTSVHLDVPQAQLGDGKVDTADLFRDLSAYLTLERAEKQSGFQASTYGLTDRQAADVAVVFNQYDTNQDGKLDVPEMQRLWYVDGCFLEGVPLLCGCFEQLYVAAAAAFPQRCNVQGAAVIGRDQSRGWAARHQPGRRCAV